MKEIRRLFINSLIKIKELPIKEKVDNFVEKYKELSLDKKKEVIANINEIFKYK